MDNNDECHSFQLIGEDGVFNIAGIDNFMREVNLQQCGLSYAVVSIMGQQRSGKSTLLNHLFGTNFRQLDAQVDLSQTTKGIWMARCVGIEPCTLVMDLEGTDGRERGADDTAFEKQSALFALVVSDILLINMWCHNIGCEQAAYKPLLRTVFQVMMQRFDPRKTTLMFVIRDKIKCTLEILERTVMEDIHGIWDAVPKPEAQTEAPLSKFFKVEVVVLSSYELQEEQFNEQVASLRQRFFHSIAPGGLAGDRRIVVPASAFSFSAQQIWNDIKANKDLNLPAHRIMIATVRCEEIANQIYASFNANEEWRQLENAVHSHLVQGFGRKLSSILNNYLSEYDAAVTFFDEGVGYSKRKQLEENLLRLVQPAHHSLLQHIRADTFERFKEAFDNAIQRGVVFVHAARECTESFMSIFNTDCRDTIIEQANWDLSGVRNKLRRDIDVHIDKARNTKLAEVKIIYETNLKEALAEPVVVLLRGAGDDTWPAIRRLFQHETDAAESGLVDALFDFDMDEESRQNMVLQLKDYARGVVEAKANEESESVLIRMKDRFFTLFSHDDASVPRTWTSKEEIQTTTRSARTASLRLLSVVVVVRLEDEDGSIDRTIFHSLMGGIMGAFTSATSFDPLASYSWIGVPPSKTLIRPAQCLSLWRQFVAETEPVVSQAIEAQAKLAKQKRNMMLAVGVGVIAGACACAVPGGAAAVPAVMERLAVVLGTLLV